MKTKVGGKTASAIRNHVRERSQSVDMVAFALEELGERSGQQSGDLQGLSNVPGADSESVDELLEEGNAFEAEVVKGVEDAEHADEKEARTHEVLQGKPNGK
ncbi:MAG: hypothetical protein WB607_12150 [Candidatus Acidiferrum sp.]